MLRIAYVDYNLNNYHTKAFLNLLRGDLRELDAEVTCSWESNPGELDWCAVHGVRRAATLEEAVEAADAVMLLAPNNPEVHLEFARRIFPAGKPVFVDKYLASSVSDAKALLALSERHSTPIFCASSLTYAPELEPLLPHADKGEIRELLVRGPGQWEGYGIHCVAIVQRLMGSAPKRLINTGLPEAPTITLDYGLGRRAVIDMRESQQHWTVSALIEDQYTQLEVSDYDAFFTNLLRNAVEFFRTGECEVTVQDALASVAILEAGKASREVGGEWREIEGLELAVPSGKAGYGR